MDRQAVSPKNSNTVLTYAVWLGAAIALCVIYPVHLAKAQNSSFSSAFLQTAKELDEALSQAPTNPKIRAATAEAEAASTPENKAAAYARIDRALGMASVNLPAIAASATTPSDKLKAGIMTRSVGLLLNDDNTKFRGLVMMLNSGALAPNVAPRVNYLASMMAYLMQDYNGALRYGRIARDAGYMDEEGLLPKIIADSQRQIATFSAEGASKNRQ